MKVSQVNLNLMKMPSQKLKILWINGLFLVAKIWLNLLEMKWKHIDFIQSCLN